MKKAQTSTNADGHRLIWTYTIIIFILCGVCLAINSPISKPTVPQSSYQPGLLRSPNPVNLSGNDIITGNVAGGKGFRGFVPYRSENEFGAPTASDSFSSFFSRTAPIDYRTRQQSYMPQPYYLPAKTVSTLRPRGNAPPLITYAPIRETGGTGEFSSIRPKSVIPIAKDLRPANVQYQYTLSRPLSFIDPADLEKIVRSGLPSTLGNEELLNSLERIRSQEDKELKKAEKTAEQPKKMAQDDTTVSPAEPVQPSERSFEPIEPAKPGQTQREADLENKNKTLYEQMLEQSGKPVRQPEIKQAKEANEPKEEEPKQKRQSDLAVIDKETAEALKGIHKTFATKAKTKFNYYMQAAEEYLKKGEYYRAADSYTLASIYNPQDPLAYAGRSHALFASGEYMSSSYYLMRAINIFPEYALIDVDINAMIPDKDRLEGRIADINKWIERTKSPELEFLLAYLYKQLGKQEQAQNAINSAAEKLPDNKAVQTLRQAIEMNK